MTETQTQLTETTGPDSALSRRGFIKAAGAATGAAVVGSRATGNTEAIIPILIAGAAVAAGGVSVGWMLRDYEVFGSDSPPDGLTASALKDRVRETVRTRKSTNASTFVDNRNIIKSGLPNTLYSEGKLAAIKALNNQKTQSEVQTAAISAMESYLATIQQNLLKTWNESVNEFITLTSALESHSDLSVSDLIDTGGTDTSSFESVSRSLSLADGSSFSLQRVRRNMSGDEYWAVTWDPVEKSASTGAFDVTVHIDDAISYLKYSTWNSVWSDLQTVKTDVNNGLITWVENVYSQVQSGEIETADLMSQRELAALDSGEQAATNQAIRDLMALGISSNDGTEVTISLEDVGATLSGRLAVAGGETTVSTGTIDPTADDYDYYFTYDVSEMSGVWESYQTGVDGGNVTFTSEPYEEIVYVVTTTADETAELKASDFSSSTSSGSTVWTASISDQVDTAITEVSGVEYYATTEETSYSTVQLQKVFTVKSITNGSGKEVNSADYTRSTEPQTDSNYITQEEWEQQRKQYEQMIEDYEASQNSGSGAIIDPSQFGFNLGGMAIPGVATLGVGVAAVLGFLGWSQSN